MATAYLDRHLDEIRTAARIISPFVYRTQIVRAHTDPSLLLKLESEQVTKSFKVRGAFAAIVRRQVDLHSYEGVITASSGNHAAAVAVAARAIGVRAVALIPADADPLKIRAARDYGAEVISSGVTFENRDQLLQALAAERKLMPVHSYDDWDVIHGQATVALEVLEDCPAPRAVVVPVSGGGLLAGSALTIKALAADVQIIGVEPELANDAFRSLRTRRLQRLESSPRTIADGARAVCIGERNFEVIVTQGLVDDIVTVREADLKRAIRLAWQVLELAIEPTAALPLAAYLSGKLPASTAGSPIVLVISGGNAGAARTAGPESVPRTRQSTRP